LTSRGFSFWCTEPSQIQLRVYCSMAVSRIAAIALSVDFLLPVQALRRDFKKTQSIVQRSCSDDHPSCADWATNGECQANPVWMLENCALSCGVCSCSDDNPSCADWAANGECEANPGYMLENCALSCGECGTVPSPQPPQPIPTPSPPTPSPTPSPNPTPGGSGCCRFEADCGDCGEDGTGWCHQSASNCEVCTGVFDPSGSPPISCGGNPSPSPGPPTPPAPTPPAPPGSPVEMHGQLRVQGNRVVDANGNPAQFTGMSLFWSQWMGQYWNANAVDWLIDDFGCTLIRCAMGVDQGGYLENPEGEKAKVRAVVNQAIARGIYVIIDWHDHHAENHVSQSIQFFNEMAQQYGSFPNVLFETYNEPLQVSWSGVVKPYHERIVPVIRAHSQNIIMLGTTTWSQDVEIAAADRVAGDNLAYVFHFYATSHKDGNRAKAQQALDAGVALFGSEWGTCDASGNGAYDFDSTRVWLNFMKDNHISWANWAVADKDESASIIRPGASGNGGWADSQLTESGRFIRSVLRGEGGSGGCCRFGADCGDCGDDGTGWCHQSASNCATCTGSFDPSGPAPGCR